MASLPRQMGEGGLIEAARDDPVAFGALYEQHVDAIYAYAVQRVRDRVVAEDVVSETFHRALENLERYEWRGVPFSAWLYRIASNVIAARYRREPLAVLDDDDLLDGADGPEQTALASERRRELLAAVGVLPSEQQQVIILRYGHGLRNKEIAYVMDRSEGAVKQLMHRAIGGLQRRLSGADDDRL